MTARDDQSDDETDRAFAEIVNNMRTNPAPQPTPNETEALEDIDRPDGAPFVPPTPPPLGRPGRRAYLTWIPAVAGPIFLLFCAMAWRSVPTILIGVGVAAFIVGMVNIVASLRPEREDPTDDGARV